MNRNSGICILCYKYTDSYFMDYGFLCWDCKPMVKRKEIKDSKKPIIIDRNALKITYLVDNK